MKRGISRGHFLRIAGCFAGSLLLPVRSAGAATRVPSRDTSVEDLLLQMYGGLNLYWGDIHGHTGFSDGYGLPDEYYDRARNDKLLDFCAISDHAEFISHYSKNIRMSDGSATPLWRMLYDAANAHNVPGQFATLHGWEWTSNKYGHRNVYFRDATNIARNPVGVLTHTTPDQLWAELEQYTCLTISHHPMRKDRLTDWNYINDMERLVEIYSKWGCAESAYGDYEEYYAYRKNPKDRALAVGHGVASALNRGYRLGMTAGTDSHQGLAGSTKWDLVRGASINADREFLLGLTGEEFLDWLAAGGTYDHREPRPSGGGLFGAWADGLARESIWDAMYDRQTIATTGIRPMVRFAIRDSGTEEFALMGSEFVIGPADPEIAYHVAADPDSGIEKIEVKRNSEVISTIVCNGESEASGSIVDGGTIEGNTYYYSLKIFFTQVANSDDDAIFDMNAHPRLTDDPQLSELAWTSPIWVSRG
jgi:hypothetical protein